MFMTDYNQIIREHFDLSDKNTRQYIVSLEDAGQEQLLTALSSSLYDKIVDKVDDIDFGTIPASRGDITKVQGFDNTLECLNIIRRLVVEYKQDPSIVDVVLSAIQNVRDRKGVFMKGYAYNAELPIVMYNTVVLAIERSTSLMIATCIQYIKDPASNDIKAALDKAAYQKTMDDLLFNQLINFNNMANNKTLDKVLNGVTTKSYREEVEYQYDVNMPIDDTEAPEECGDDSTDAPEIESPFAPDNTTDETEGDNEEEAPVNPDELPAPNDFPEDAPEEDPAPIEDEEIDIDAEVNPADDQVEKDNIPAVVPGDDVTPDDKPIQEIGVAAAIGTAIGIAAAAKAIPYLITHAIIPSLRNMIYAFYYSSAKFSDYLEVQADLIEANANELKYSTSSELSDDNRKKSVKKQMKIVEKLRKWSNKFSIDQKTSNNKAKKESEKDARDKHTIKGDSVEAYLF